ncbi:hypothetical protein FO519_001284 [Halicephalobus sp. NKZ332]|nr:hypothetical protein FO519_001284 [Halicephalobus sp. NKZ332]
MTGRGYRELPSDAPSPRLCLVQKQYASQEYGFNLHAEKEKGQFIGIVDVGSPADLGGLKQGDRIFAVNGVSISGLSHKNVVAQIKSDPLKCEMLVLSNDDFEWYASHNIPVDMTLPNIIRVCEEFYDEITSASSSSLMERSKTTTVSIKSSESPMMVKVYKTTIEKRQSASGKSVVGGGQKPSMAPPARLSRLQKQSPADEFGFNLHAERGKGHFIGSVDQGGIADRAGLVMGQRIVGVNNALIYPNTPHKDVVSLIKKDPFCTELLVVSEEIDHWYSENSTEFSFDNCVRYNSDPVPPRGSIPTINVIESRIEMEKLSVQDELVESHPIEEKISDGLLSEPDNTIKQVTTLSTTQTISVTEAVPETPEDTDDLIDKIFKDVPLAPVEARVSIADSIDTLPSNGEHDSRPPLSSAHVESASEDTNTRVSSSVIREHSPKPLSQVPLVVPPAQKQFSENKSQKITSDSRSNGNSNGVDVFKLNAKEARQMLRKQKNDPRKNNLSLEQKHQMVANL